MGGNVINVVRARPARSDLAGRLLVAGVRSELDKGRLSLRRVKKILGNSADDLNVPCACECAAGRQENITG